MSEIIFEIIARSITLKAKQEEGKALLSCTKSKIEEKERKTKQVFLYIYQDLDGLWKNLEKNFCVIVLIGVRDVD
jgi:hypothetical protein